MKVWRASIILLALLLPLLFLTGCKSTLIVHDAAMEDIIPVLDDYAGTHGYRITYRNDEIGSFRLSLGNVYMPETSETIKTKEITKRVPPEDSNQPFTAYEETTLKTVSMPGHYVEATAMVSIVQQDQDVLIEINANNAGGSSLGDLSDYIKDFGYAVDNK